MMHLEKIVTGDNDKQEQVLMPSSTKKILTVLKQWYITAKS